MDYNHEFWIGFLCEQVARQCVEMSVIKCPACQHHLFSPILHLHHQLSLLDKLKNYFEEVRGSMLTAVDAYYTQFEDNLPHSKNLKTDRVIYNNIGVNFLIQAKAQTIYYGRYVTELNDSHINDSFKIKKCVDKTH